MIIHEDTRAAQLCVKLAELEAQIEKAWASYELDAEAYHAEVDAGAEADQAMNPHVRLKGLFAQRQAAAAELREMRARW